MAGKRVLYALTVNTFTIMNAVFMRGGSKIMMSKNTGFDSNQIGER